MDNIQYDLSEPKTSFSLESNANAPTTVKSNPVMQKKKSDPEIQKPDTNITAETNNDDEAEKIKKSKEFEEAVKKFVLKNKPFVAIMTPCFASITYVDYMSCLIKTIEMLQYFNIPVKVEFCKSDSLISRARNNLIAKSMYNTEVTHMLFIDNDIVWDPVEVLKLLLSEKDLIGGIYPLKQYMWDRLKNVSALSTVLEKKKTSQLKEIPDEFFLQTNLLNYNVNFLDNTIQVEKNLTKVKHLATGFMMIRREVIEKMMTAFPSTKYTDDINFLLPEENKYAYALFDCGVEDNHYYSEDWMFCHRWSKMGGDVFVDVSINLTHIGIENYCGSFISTTI
jgi:hypothetical protein